MSHNYTPFDIQNKEFSKSINGFNKTEVTEYLMKIGDIIESLMREADFLKTQIIVSEKKLTEYQSQENSLKEALLIAQITSNDILKKAKTNSDEIIKKANFESEKILHGVKAEYVKIETATDLLKRDYSDFKNKYQQILNEQIKVLDRI